VVARQLIPDGPPLLAACGGGHGGLVEAHLGPPDDGAGGAHDAVVPLEEFHSGLAVTSLVGGGELDVTPGG
jgi:hypothetical protein